MEQEEFIDCLRTIVNSGKQPSTDKSITGLVSDFTNIDPKFIGKILANFDDFENFFKAEKTELMALLGVKPGEKATVAELLSRLRIDKILNNGIIENTGIKRINIAFQQSGLTFQLQSQYAPQLPSIVSKLNAINRGLYNLDLLECLEESRRIAIFGKRYVNMPVQKIQQDNTALQNALKEVEASLPDNDKMASVIITTLREFGYPEIALIDKDLGRLDTMLYQSSLSAKGALDAIKKRGTVRINENDIIDGIARMLVTEKREQQLIQS